MNENIIQIINHIQSVLDKNETDENYHEIIKLISDDNEVSWENGIKLGQLEQHKALRDVNYSIKDIIYALINEFDKKDFMASQGIDGSYAIRLYIGDGITVYVDSRNIHNEYEKRWIESLSSKILFDKSIYPEFDEEIESLVTILFQDEQKKEM